MPEQVNSKENARYRQLRHLGAEGKDGRTRLKPQWEKRHHTRAGREEFFNAER
jgi:hypothetical protein